MNDCVDTWCAEVPHPLIAVYLYWCSRDQAWRFWETDGTTDKPTDRGCLDFGPLATVDYIYGYMSQVFKPQRLMELMGQ